MGIKKDHKDCSSNLYDQHNQHVIYDIVITFYHMLIQNSNYICQKNKKEE